METIHPFTITAAFDAPLSLLWKAWTEEDQLRQWFSPEGLHMVSANLDFRPGGIFLYCLRSDEDAFELWGKFVYREIEPHQRIVCVNSFSDPAGGLSRHPGEPHWPLVMLTTITFSEAGGKSAVTVEWIPLNPTSEEIKKFNSGHSDCTQGWNGTFRFLAKHLVSNKL